MGEKMVSWGLRDRTEGGGEMKETAMAMEERWWERAREREREAVSMAYAFPRALRFEKER